MEFIFPYRMGYQPVLLSKMNELDDWSRAMIELPLYKSSDTGKILKSLLADPRANQIRCIRGPSRIIEPLAKYHSQIPQLDTVFLEGHEFQSRTDPTILLSAFPGLSKLYLKKGLGDPGQPLRHIGLDYLGIPYTTSAKKRLSDFVLPNLKILALNLEGVHFFDAPVLASEALEDLANIMTGDQFPLLERLYLSHCGFVNRFIDQVLVKQSDSISVRKLDLMDSYENDVSGKKTGLNGAALYQSVSEMDIHLTVDENISSNSSDRVRQGVTLLPY